MVNELTLFYIPAYGVFFGVLCILISKLIFYILNIKSNKDEVFDIYEKLIIGLVVVSIIYSSFKTNFQTIIIGAIIFLIYYLIYRKNMYLDDNIGCSRRLCRKDIFEFLLIYLFTYFLQLHSIYSFNTSVFIPANADLHKASYYINDILSSGIERTATPAVPSTELSAPTPYHYFEYWLIGLISDISRLPPFLILKLTVVPLFSMIYYMGLSSIFVFFKKKSPSIFEKLLLFLSFMFVPCILIFDFFTSFGFNDDNFITNFFLEDAIAFKTFPLVLLWLLFFYWMIRKEIKIAIAVLMVIPIINYSTFPPLIVSVFALLFLLFFKRKSINLKTSDILHISLGYIIVLAYLMFFYNISDLPFKFSGKKALFSINNLIAFYSKKSSFIRLIEYSIWELMKLLLSSLIPISLFIIFIRKYKNFKYTFWITVFFISAIVLSSFGLYVLFFFTYNNFGFYRVHIYPILSLSTLILCFYFINTKNILLRYSAILIIITSSVYSLSKYVKFNVKRKAYIANQIDTKYYSYIKNVFKEKDLSKGISFHSERKLKLKDFLDYMEYDITYTNTSISQRLDHDFYYPSMFIDYFGQDVRIYSVSRCVSNEDFSFIDKELESVNYFSLWQKEQPKKFDKDDYMLQFINKYDIEFIVATSNAKIPLKVLSVVEDSIISNLNGERFYLLRK
jgi:hypothetical protein